MAAGRKLISIMTPCFNEEGNLRNLYQRVTKVIDGMTDYDFEWVIIDNDSQDSSRQILRELAEKDSRLKVIFNLRNFGPGRSSAYGLYQTSGDASICVAGDLQDPPELIPRFIQAWEAGNDVVLGRIKTSEESARAFATRGFFYRIINAFSDTKIESHVTGFGLYSKRAVSLLREEANPVPNFRFSISSFGFHVAYVDYIQPLRVAGKSSYTFVSKLDTSIDSLIQASVRPVRLVTLSGAILAGLTALLIVIFLVLDVAFSALVWWRLLVCSLIFFVAGLLALAVGLVGEYVVSVLEHVKGEPLVIERERFNFVEGHSELPEVAESSLIAAKNQSNDGGGAHAAVAKR